MKHQIFLIILLVTTVFSACVDHFGDCAGCMADSVGNCGYCGDTGECLTGTVTGPTNLGGESVVGSCPDKWQVDFASQVMLNIEGYPVDPSISNIFLRPNDDVVLPVNIIRPFSDDIPVDLSILQDASGSMRPYMEKFASLVPRIMAGVLSEYKSAYFGHNSYIDKTNLNFASTDRDYQIQFNTPGLESRPSTMLLAAKQSIEAIGWGDDFPEDPISALVYSVKCESLMRWRTGSRKFVFIATDATFHVPGEFNHPTNADFQPCRHACSGNNSLTDGICELRTSGGSIVCNEAFCSNYKTSCYDNNCYEPLLPPGTTLSERASGSGITWKYCEYTPIVQDYECHPDPTNSVVITDSDIPYKDYRWGRSFEFMDLARVKQILIEEDTNVIVGITRSGGIGQFQDLIENVWEYGVYEELGDGGGRVVDAILNSISTLAGQIILRAVETDTYVTGIVPAAGYQNVQVLQRVNFQVTFESSSPVPRVLTLLAVGFPSVTVNIFTTPQCYGCDNVAGSGATIDLCGKCNPAVPNECLGCDNVTFSGATFDLCGVCDGDNTACAGCDGIPNSNTTFDVCGICGGNGDTCRDCFDVVNGTAIRDQCNVCGGNDSCVGCDGIPNSNLTLDRCGICAGNDFCIDCFGNPSRNPARFDQCGKCNGTNDCIDCFGVAFGNATLDDCGICGGNNSTCYGCSGKADPPLFYDSCGVCGGNDSCYGCDGKKDSNLTLDDCGACGGNNSCFGCDDKIGRPPLVYDTCKKCGGNNSCWGCDNVPFSRKTFDRCGKCGGKDLCVGCDGVVNSTATLDKCGKCNGNNTCVGCDGVPNSPYKYDACGICGGSNTTCAGCDGVPNSGLKFDRCRVCNGTNACLNTVDEIVPDNAITDETLAVIIAGSVIAIIIGVLAAISFLTVQRAVNGANWFVPVDLKGKLNTLQKNPLYTQQAATTNPRFGRS